MIIFHLPKFLFPFPSILSYTYSIFPSPPGSKIDEDGIEDAFEVVGEVGEVMRTGVWVGDCFIYTNSMNRLNYFVGGEIVTVSHLDKTCYILGSRSAFTLGGGCCCCCGPGSTHKNDMVKRLSCCDFPRVSCHAMLVFSRSLLDLSHLHIEVHPFPSKNLSGYHFIDMHHGLLMCLVVPSGYLPKENRIYLGDKEMNVISYALLLSVMEYQVGWMSSTAMNALCETLKTMYDLVAAPVGCLIRR